MEKIIDITDILDQKKEKRMFYSCGRCSKPTGIRKDIDVSLIPGYVDGAGILCGRCMGEVYDI